jgi:internalin A
LRDNQLTSLPPEIGQLVALQRLDLRHNDLIDLPPDIGCLNQLRWLYLGDNQLSSLPTELGNLTSLQFLGLSDNPDFPLPPEILVKVDEPQAIIHAYLDFLAGQRHPLNEVKMILVGQGSVGKTSLATCLLDGPESFDPHETKTEGIDIRRWSLPLPQSTNLPARRATQSTDIHINVWDFGGQEIMHATHQFFLTHRTLYLLVLDTRLSEAENRLEYWLQIIRGFGGDSPVILVGNKTDQQPLDIDRGGIRDKYPSIKAIVETSCVTGEGIDALQATIAELAPTLPHVFDELLSTWFDVKAELEEVDADYIPYSQYTQMCQEAGVTKEQSQRTLLGFLHDLGIVLHFPDPRLETTNILNPEWVTQGVYRILNSHVLFQNGGVLTRELLAQILEGPKYPRDKHMFIVDMMRKFELCYPFPGQAHTYLVPDLLPKEERYTGEWDDALTFQIHYEILPGSVFSRFIVRMHRCIHQHTVWRTGVLLALDGNQALVRADLTDNRTLIRVRGPAAGRRDLLTRIREQFDAIHYTIQGLQVEEKVPLPGHPELPPVDYDHLITLEQLGEETFIPQGLAERVSVRDLLNGVESPSTRRARDPERGSIVIQDSHIKHFGDNIAKPEERSRQMDPITGAIVAALAAGVASGAGEVGKKVVVDAYSALKAAIKKKYGTESKVAQAVTAVEEEPDFEPNQQALAGRVEQVDAAEDPELQELAQKLLEALEETSRGKEALGKYNIQIDGGQVGVISDHAEIEGGIHFGSSKE